jgi:class 3 adenylate cyclase/tetratricopeptide (TPR) repeat protein
MTCACGRENRAGARFCDGCGKPLAPRCPACGAEARPDAQFCDACGGRLAERAAAAPADETVARKVVTIVFADLIGSTSLHERLDPESVRRVMARYHQAVRVPVEAHGGTVVQLLGDGVMCAFGVPRVAEDDAIRAVRAAVGIQRAFREFARAEQAILGQVGLRVALNTGEVVVTDDYAAGIGDPLNVAARLQQEAHDGDVLISESTRRLVAEHVTLESFGVLSLKGRAETVAAYRVVSLERAPGASAMPFVGRDDELRRVMAVYDAAVGSRRARMVVVLGSPGLGKSRLMGEVARRLGDGATVLHAQCDAAGGATFAPIAKAVRAHLGVDDAVAGDALRTTIEATLPADDADRGRIAGGLASLLAGTPAPPEETFFVVRRFLAALAAARPVVLAIDDLHWAEPLLLDLTEHLIQWSTEAPLLVLAAARPELRESRSSLTVPAGVVTDVVTLAGLDAGAATRLAANVIGATELPAAVAGRVLATSEGNPLFVGELVRMLVADGALKREGDRWTAGVELAHVEMPPTIQALLAARIERLRPEERTVLERAAVVGRQFSRAAVTHLLPREIGDLDARLEALRRSELIESDAGWYLGEPALRFHHVLVRDAAYRRLLKNTRAELHARFADWLETRVGDAVEHDETMGWHLEQAHQNLRELGPVDARGRTLGERAARHLAAAGRRALARDDLPLASGLLGRALDRLDSTDPVRADLALDWCEALLAAGDVGPAGPAIEELDGFAGESPRLRAWHTCFAGQLAALIDPQSLRATADAVAAAAEALAATGDAAGEAKAHSVHAIALGRLGRVGACEAALDRALAAARRAGDRRRSNAVLASAPLAALWGPSPVTRASGRCLDVVRVLRITQGAPAVEAVALRCQGVLEALRGRTEAARRMLASSRRMVEELGITQRLLEADVFAGLVDLLEGDAAAAERSLRSAYEGLRDHGLGIDAAQAAALLGRALLALGRAEEAEVVSHESEALAGDDLRAAVAWRGVRAEALARRGEHAAAVEFARAAVDTAAATDALLDHADARLALAAVLRAGGRLAEADAEEARAIELWEAKGATLLAERVRRDVERVMHGDRVREDRTQAARRVRRRVQANAATAHAACLDAAIAARDLDTIEASIVEGLESVSHPTGTVHDRQAVLGTWRSLLRAEDPTCRHEPLATLGESLVLCRRYISGSRFAGATFDVAAYEKHEISLLEVDSTGRESHCELFAEDRGLATAVARLYERYAELLPDGAERTRAAATARSVATLMGPPASRSFEVLWARDTEYVDHRRLGFGTAKGADRVLRGHRAQFEIADDVTYRCDDVLALRPDAWLKRGTTSGTDRTGGGAYESTFLDIVLFGSDGLVVRSEWFDQDATDQALARFDELTAGPVVPSAAAPAAVRRERPVRPNAATAFAARLDAAVAARDVDTVATLYHERDYEVVDHTTGTTYGVGGVLQGWRALIRDGQPILRHEPLATLGDFLGLFRETMRASRFTGAKFDVASFEREGLFLIEVDRHGQSTRGEQFGVDHLAEAIARFYERHAELLPDGPGRDRATATARSVATMTGPLDPHARDELLAANIEFVDHRRLGFGTTHGVKTNLRGFRLQFEVADDIVHRYDDVLELRHDMMLVRRTTSGTSRLGGGRFETEKLVLHAFGADGLVVRMEWFDVDDAERALARFDELAGAPARATRRRVRPNAATANAARTEAAVAAREFDALADLVRDLTECIDHRTGTVYGRDGILASWRHEVHGTDFALRLDPLATLGDSVALLGSSISATSFAMERFDVGTYEHQSFAVIDVDADGRTTRAEMFAADRLADAVVCAYERHAARLPDGPARVRAAATAHAVALGLPFPDPDRYHEVVSPDIETVDHRSMGLMGAVRGIERNLRAHRSLLDLTDDFTVHFDDVLALEHDAFLLRTTNSGRTRIGGGTFGREFLVLCTFGAAGRMNRMEWFDIGRETEALARFDELRATQARPAPAETRDELAGHGDRLPATEPPAFRFANAATRMNERFLRAWAARDWDALVALHGSNLHVDDRRRLVQLRSLSDDSFALLRVQFEVPNSRWVVTPIATRGTRLALSRVLFEGDVEEGGGELAIDYLAVDEVDANGLSVDLVFFDPDDLDAAYAELDARFGVEVGPVANWESSRRMMRAVSARDWEGLRSIFAPDFVIEDHRQLGWGTVRSGDEYVARVRGLVDLRPDVVLRIEHFLASSDRGGIVVALWSGNESSGTFEIPVVVVARNAPRPDGRVQRWDFYDVDQLDAAWASYRALTTETPRRIENTATRSADRGDEAWHARDWDGVVECVAAGYRESDRRKMVLVELDRERSLESLRVGFEMDVSSRRRELLATRGDRLALFRMRWNVSHGSVGPSEIEWLDVVEVDEHGKRIAGVIFDADDVDTAHAELDDRFSRGEAAPFEHAYGLAEFKRAFAARDWSTIQSTFAPDYALHDHRPLGWGTLDGPTYLKSLQALAQLAPDTRFRTDHHWVSAHGHLFVNTLLGTREGGAFEEPRVHVVHWDGHQGVIRHDFYALDQLDEARAHFEVLGAATSNATVTDDPAAPQSHAEVRIPPNAATRALEHYHRSLESRDRDALEALCAPTLLFEDRRRAMLTTGNREMLLESSRLVGESRARAQRRIVSTAGDRLALVLVQWRGPDSVPFEIDALDLIEVDETGRIVALLVYDLHDRAAAGIELTERFARCEAGRWLTPADIEYRRAQDAHDVDRLRAVVPDDFVFHDHRRTGVGRLEGREGLVAWLGSLFEQSADAMIEPLYYVATDDDGFLLVGHTFGTLKAGGAFESVFLQIGYNRDGLPAVGEMFELERIDDARRRFEELGRERRPVSPNAAWHAGERIGAARDRQSLRSIASEDFTFDDRRKRALVRGDVDLYFSNLEVVRSWPGLQNARELVATVGDRVTLERITFSGGADGSPFDGEFLRVVEVDAEGRLRAVVHFDSEDRDAAVADAHDRVGQ